jgi:hypothetical protein
MKTKFTISAFALSLTISQADSVTSFSPLSATSSSNSPTLVSKNALEIQTSGALSLAILNSSFLSYSAGLRYGVSDKINIDLSYSTQDYSNAKTSWDFNNGALRNALSHHLLIGAHTSIIPDYITTYINLSQGYHPKSLFTDLSLGINLGYSNNYLTPFINLEYGYSLAYNQTWVLDFDEASYSDSFRAGNSHFTSYEVGLETQFGKPDLDLKLFTAFSSSIVSTSGYLKENLEQINNNVLYSLRTGISYQL